MMAYVVLHGVGSEQSHVQCSSKDVGSALVAGDGDGDGDGD